MFKKQTAGNDCDAQPEAPGKGGRLPAAKVARDAKTSQGGKQATKKSASIMG
jgi:hypothetical protein